MSDLFERTRAHIAHDIEPADQEALRKILAAAESGDPAALTDLEDRMSGPLLFGTAGLRGLYAAGQSRMNRSVVIRATAGLVDYLIRTVPDAKDRDLVIGLDVRMGSIEMQQDTGEVAAARGMRVHFLSGTTPTPVTAFGVTHLRAAGGVMVTASHNPPAYNGYKVYWENGAQIIPPHDVGIAAVIDAQPGASSVARMARAEAEAKGLWTEASTVEPAYLAGLERMRFVPGAPVADLRIAYSALHGVGERVLRIAFLARGFQRLESVAAQAEPDGRFPTVEFPNPEEPGALDLVLALAKRIEADVVLVNDPDADRLGVATRDRSGGYRVLNGNEIGVLLAHHLLMSDPKGGKNRLVMATLVSSQLLRRMAADLGVEYRETLTGFKWIANEALREQAESGFDFVFGYEEALGYTVGTHVRDKDGISAALVMAELTASLKAQGQTLLDRLDEIRRAHGVFVSRQKSLTMPGRDGLAKIKSVMTALRARPPQNLAGAIIAKARDLSVETNPRLRGDVLIYELADGGRVSVRPSGTEPKIKFYIEVVEQVGKGSPLDAQTRGEARIDLVQKALFLAAGVSA